VFPVGFQTDVTPAALGEINFGGHGSDVNSCCYVTVGTGVGVGVVIAGKPLSGLLHPEAGHMRVARHKSDTKFEGGCPFHGDCVEGLVASGSVAKRVGCAAKDLASLPDDHEAWDYQAFYLAQLCVNLTLTVSPHVIVLGGGLLKRASLWPRIRTNFVSLMNGYIAVDKLIGGVDRYIVPSRFNAEGSRTTSGAIGSLALALDALTDAAPTPLRPPAPDMLPYAPPSPTRSAL